MRSLFFKEIGSFLSTLTGYITIVVFLLMTGLFMWVFPGEANQLERGTADLDTLFYVGPWVFMFLIPAITMRTFSEEKRTGTIELLFTKPISDAQIILSKFFAGLFLLLIAILPTFIYFLSIYLLGDPKGNLDIGGTMGSYFGLLLLGAAFVSIGIFASTLTSNQVVAFIIATFLSFVCFAGFGMIASFELLGPLDSFFLNLSLNEHYLGLSRGVIDTRDLMFFGGFCALFLILTQFVLSTRKW
ncbi:MAG: gliding motility-associated ABC transporter permease subunit GldF [Flavobacteriales bacterium]|nr:gliding motility-associated ABC transporter permease subunit GldF [Flavobacteriales bacterium]